MTAQKHLSRGPVILLLCFLSAILILVSSANAQEGQTPGLSVNMAVPDRDGANNSSSLSAIKEDEIGKIRSWHATSGVNEQGEHLTIIRLSAKKPHVTSADDGINPDLVISCKLDETTLYVDWKTPISSADGINADIKYTLDDNDPIDESWRLSSDKNMIFSHAAVDFIKSLNDANKLYIELTPYSQPKTRVSFSLNGIDEVLTLIGERCYHSGEFPM